MTLHTRGRRDGPRAPRAADRRTGARARRAVRGRLHVGFVLGAALSMSCTETVGPERSLGREPLPAPAFAVAIVPDGESSTGVPLLRLPDQIGTTFITSAMSAINEDNWVVGTASDARAVLWRGAELEVIWGSSARTTRGFGLNESGMVVGEWVGSGGGSLGFRWQDGSGPDLLTEPPGYALGRAEARGVDEAGDILLYYERNNPCGVGPSIIDATAVMKPPYTSVNDYTLIQGPVCENDISGRAIDGGTVMGSLSTRGNPSDAFRWLAGATELIGDWVPRALEGGFAAGSRFDGVASIAVRYAGGLEDLGTLSGENSSARGVNRLGWVVGHSETADGETHAFLWTPAGGIVDLGTLGGAFSTAADVNDQGYIVGDAAIDTGRRVPVVWFVDPAASDNQPPDIEPIISQVVTVGETLEVTPVVTDPEGDPFTLTWTDLPPGATANGTLTWTPAADEAGNSYTVTVTARQDDDPTLFDSESFVISVLAAEQPAAELAVTLAPVAPEQRFAGDAARYIASVHNEGPDAVPVDLTVELQHIHAGAEWGDIPPEAAANGIFFLELGEVAAGTTVDVPFEVAYGAFGVHGVTASVASEAIGETEKNLADNVAMLDQVIDLSLGTPGVQTGGLDIPGAHTTDGGGLALVGVRVPSELIAGHPEWDLFLPADLTPTDVLPGVQLIDGATFTAGGHFVPDIDHIAGDAPILDGPAEALLRPAEFVPQADQWPPGRAFVPAVNAWDPAGRLIFERGGTTVRVHDRANTTLSLEKGAGPGVKVNAGGGTSDARLGLCAAGYQAHTGDGDGAEFACGSLTTTALTGEVTIVLDDGTRVDVPAGSTALITELDGGYEIGARDGPVTVTSGEETFDLPAGETVFIPRAEAALEGCKLGFWRQRADVARFPGGWPPTGYGPGDDFETVFDVEIGDPGPTLEEALQARGGGLNALLRQAVSALLNAAHPDVDFGLDVETVIPMVQEAIAAGDHDPVTALLDELNSAGCPIDGR